MPVKNTADQPSNFDHMHADFLCQI